MHTSKLLFVFLIHSMIVLMCALTMLISISLPYVANALCLLSCVAIAVLPFIVLYFSVRYKVSIIEFTLYVVALGILIALQAFALYGATVG
jgi:hypothetical protein